VIYTDQQIANIRRGIHPDCALADPCTACGASEATGVCAGDCSELVHLLFVAAYRNSHNSDPAYVLHTTGSVTDAGLFDEAARKIFASELVAPAATPSPDRVQS
jgi:hypothetical protein